MISPCSALQSPLHAPLNSPGPWSNLQGKTGFYPLGEAQKHWRRGPGDKHQLPSTPLPWHRSPPGPAPWSTLSSLHASAGVHRWLPARIQEAQSSKQTLLALTQTPEVGRDARKESHPNSRAISSSLFSSQTPSSPSWGLSPVPPAQRAQPLSDRRLHQEDKPSCSKEPPFSPPLHSSFKGTLL